MIKSIHKKRAEYIMKIQNAIELGQEKLKYCKKSEAKFYAKRILAFVLNKDMTYLAVHADEDINISLEIKYMEFLKKVENGIPLQYITNKQNFMGIEFYVDENVLIPQPDTEILVEEVMEIIKNEHKKNVLDLCTGSGAIAISVANYITNIKIVASDISKNALDIAKKNAINNACNIEFIQSDLFENIIDKFDVIVSNPPYIKTNEIEKLEKEVQNEPFLALDGGEDGLKFYRSIIGHAKRYLNPNGYLAVEIGYDQKNEVLDIFKYERYENIYSKKDFGGNNRIVVGKRR